jgi:hypothetical protein
MKIEPRGKQYTRGLRRERDSDAKKIRWEGLEGMGLDLKERVMWERIG